MEKHKLRMGWYISILLVGATLLWYVRLLGRDQPPRADIPDRPVATPSPSQPVETVPEPPSPYPSTIPGLVAASVHEPLTKQGFKLEMQTNLALDNGTRAAMAWIYKNQRDGCDFEVLMHGDGPTAIKFIQATVTHTTGGDPTQQAVPFLGELATVPYDECRPQAAREWVEEYIAQSDTVGFTVFSKVLFVNDCGESVRILIIKPNIRLFK